MRRKINSQELLTENGIRVLLGLAGYKWKANIKNKYKKYIEYNNSTFTFAEDFEKLRIKRHKPKNDVSLFKKLKEIKSSLSSPSFLTRRYLLIDRIDLTNENIQHQLEKPLSKWEFVKKRNINKKIKSSPTYWYIMKGLPNFRFIAQQMVIHDERLNFIKTPYFEYYWNDNYIKIMTRAFGAFGYPPKESERNEQREFLKKALVVSPTFFNFVFFYEDSNRFNRIGRYLSAVDFVFEKRLLKENSLGYSEAFALLSPLLVKVLVMCLLFDKLRGGDKTINFTKTLN